MIYYIDPQNGNDAYSGLSQSRPKKNYRLIFPKGGDSILFRRSCVIREQLRTVGGEDGKPVTYGAYGEGEKPVFCGSVNLSDPGLWTEEGENLWSTEAVKDDEACNIIFDNGASFGTLRWTKEELCAQGDFFDNCFGSKNRNKPIGDDHRIWLYSEKNPAVYYTSVEVAVYGERFLAELNSNVTFENLCFLNGGVHAAAGYYGARNLKVLNCDIRNIGGCVWSYEKRIRFGNGIECWDIAENAEVSGCVFDNIYDSAVTHQGSKDKCRPCENVFFVNNVFMRCGMAAYEQRDLFPKYAVFSNNVCIDAGAGFSAQGEIMPRKSEIWPQPMGHHVFLWRITKPAEGGKMEIKNNIFYNAPYGAAVYSIIGTEAEKQIDISNNTYYTQNTALLTRLGGIDYKNFDEYSGTENGAKYEKCDIEKYIR